MAVVSNADGHLVAFFLACSEACLRRVSEAGDRVRQYSNFCGKSRQGRGGIRRHGS